MRIPMAPPPLGEILSRISSPDHPERLMEILVLGIGAAPDGKYRHWDTLRHVAPPTDLTHEEWWAAIKLARMQSRREIQLRDTSGRPFTYSTPDPLLQMLHGIDRNATGQIAATDAITNPQTRDRYIQSSLIEEAITSSQLEGAASTHDDAKKMIRSGRAPLDKSERMILNNYNAIRLISQYKNEPLSRELLFEIHRTITRDTLDITGGPDHLRTSDDSAVKVRDSLGNILHSPPPAEELLSRIDNLCRFANEMPADVFLHPVVKAIILHFWLAYDHPFTDGNGRTARALFYWCMLAQGYWLFEFISISRILLSAPAKYSRSFLYTETDDNDLTYFVLCQLRVICRAIEQLQEYIRRKTGEVRVIERLVRTNLDLNHRQLALLSHALRHPGFRYTISSHKASHRITYQTARTDLLGLGGLGLLERGRSGRQFVFNPPSDIEERLKALAMPETASPRDSAS